MCKVYYDKDGWFLIKLIEGAKKGVKVLDMLNVLYEIPKNGDGIFDFSVLFKDCNDTKKVCIEKLDLDNIDKVFPCVIVVRKQFLKKWREKCVEQREFYKKAQSVLEKAKEQNKEWIKEEQAVLYNKCLNEEMKRFENLGQAIQSYDKNLQKHLEGLFSFFNNSSIWVRLVDWNEKEINKAINEFKYFKSIGLYEYGSAKENLDYNIRIQFQNYLNSSIGGHGNYVTPVLYGDEVWAKNFLKKNNVTLTLDDEQIKNAKDTLLRNIDSINSENESEEVKRAKTILQENKTKSQSQNDLEFKHLLHFHDLSLRILLIDDKVGECSTKEYVKISDFGEQKKKIEIKECDKCNKKECKLKAIKSLMDDGSSEDDKKFVFDQIGEKDENNVLKKDFFYWKESGIKTYYCPTIIEDFIDNDDNTLDFSKYSDIKVYSDSEQKLSNKPTDEENKPKTLEVECHFEPKIKKNDLHVQIVGVRDVRTALLLLSKYKFDMVFSDYLLDYEDSNRNEREYANQLFTFLAHDYKKELKGGEKTAKWEVLDKLRHDVLDNRGPLGQMWIMPITGFNQTFIQDIYRNGTNLIDYKWNISNGADPITTPWQFLYHLNKFIELQLCLSVFRMKQLLQFLKYTCEDLEDLNKAQNDELCFDDFKSFMGSEYATFIQLYGNKLPIKRDALIKGGADNNSDSKSVFATYVWNKFYSSKETYNSVELCRLMHRFYFQASNMYNDRVGIQRLNEAFANLLFFVKTNSRVEAVIKENEGKIGGLREELAVLRESISKCTNNQQEKNN